MTAPVISPHSRRRPKDVPRSAPDTKLATSAMIASLDAEGRATVDAPFGHTLAELARHDDRILGLSADLSKYTDLHVFAAAHPDRFYQMGMAEQVMFSAAAGLAREGISCAVLHSPTIKPLDTETIRRESAQSGRLVIVAENHSITSGLGEAVAACLMRGGVHVPFRQIGLPDEFLDAGALPTLHHQYGLSVDAICASVRGWVDA